MIRCDELLAATGGRLVGRGATTWRGFAYDSRTLEPGSLFVAMVTATGDGHEHIAAAVRAGASGVLCQHLPDPLPAAVPCLLVPDTRQALLDYARAVLRRRRIDVIGVTGSVGKTSTKEAIAAVLGERERVFRNPGSYNGRFGLPVSLGLLEDDAAVAVLEMATDAKGEIEELAEIIRPIIGVVTTVGSSHLQVFGSLQAIAREKAALVRALPADGVAVLNWDDPRVRAMANETRARILAWSTDPAAPLPEGGLHGTDVRVSPEGTEVTVRRGAEAHTLRIPLLGPQHAGTVLAACAVGLARGLRWGEIARGLERVDPLPGRTRLLPGLNGATLLDDAYNASPESLGAALATLAALPARRRIVVLGDMAELGAQAVGAHREAGARIAAAGVNLLVTLGDSARLAADGAIAGGMPPERVIVTYAAEDAARALHAQTGAGDLVLLKASAEARLEAVTRALLDNPDRDAPLLPRQGPGWQQVTLRRPGRPAWVEIDLGAVAHNTQRLIELAGPGVQVMAVLKADAYGHGAARVARTALNNGATWVGVACLGEAIDLRETGISAPILSLGYTPPWQAREAVRYDVSTTLYSLDLATALSRAAADLGRPARVHVKVDTGMGRLGLWPDEVPSFVRATRALPGLTVEGLFTHFATADAADLSYTREQLAAFRGVIAALRAQDLLPPLVHAANSAAALRVPESRLNMIRPGIAIMGLNPSAEAPLPSGFRAALSFKCALAQVKDLPPGAPVGYGCTWRAQRPSRIGVIPVGYADGFRRAPANWGEVLVRGRRAPLVGSVCMDQSMIDVTDVPDARAGDEVVLIGSQGEDAITADEVAARLGTISYEVVSAILARVPRIV